MLGCVLFSLLAGCAQEQFQSHPTTAPSTYREAEEIKAALTYLASDQLEGRGLQTGGINKAADYIATQFRLADLKPLPGMEGYFQEFPINIATTIIAGSCRSNRFLLANAVRRQEQVAQACFR